ncbi:MAG: NADH-quinone oxidoreductase subunit L [bacterium]|nr:NADH-quinone oxidoreductase subunit L [bacterium]
MDPIHLLLTTVFAPLFGFAIALIFLMRQPRASQVIVILAGLASVISSIVLLLQGPDEPLRFLWFASGDLQLQFGFVRDGASLMFGVVVALITACVMVYSTGYMGHDPDKTRYFAMLGLFAWAMLGYVYAVDLLQAFIFWELVGLASFFLIGFWYEKPSAAAAARKAFLMTRVGDVGLFVGILLILQNTANFDIPWLIDPNVGLVTRVSEDKLNLIMLLIFIGIMGKSAQFPLHTWLPDAMEGPTPVSALLHSATMVAAGVFLMIRLHPLFMAAESTSLLILGIATFTAVLSSTIAMVDNDIKKVLAYSSISQLGFMLMGLASGSLFAGVFHLITHAFFKALLFLCSGIYIHAFGTNDMAEIGRKGGARLKITTVGLLVGGAALAGLPPLAGFWSKEEIFAQMGHHGFSIYMAGAFFAAFLTAYYSFRMIFLIVKPDRAEPHAAEHGHSHEPMSMTVPVMILTVGAIVMGYFGDQIGAALGVHITHHSLSAMMPAIAVVLIGIGVAYLDYGRKGAARTGFITRITPLHTLFVNKWYLDEFYRVTVVALTMALARLMNWFETHLFDSNYDRIGLEILRSGSTSTRLQAGWMQLYLVWAVLVAAAVAIYIGWS